MMGGRSVILSLAGMIAVLMASTGRAQNAVLGSRVRIVGVNRQAIATGTLVRWRGDTIVLTDSADITRVLALQAGYRLEISVGTDRRRLRGMGIGLLAGAAVGGIIGAATYQEAPANPLGLCIACGPEYDIALGAIFGAVSGLVIGGIVGGGKRERWVSIGTQTSRVVRLQPGWHRTALTVSISFE